MLRFCSRITLWAAAAALFAAGAAHADAPRIIGFQGVAKTPGGTPATGPVDIQVSLYNGPGAGATVLFGPENHAATPLDPNGLFSLQVGANTAGGVPVTALNAAEVYLGVKVGADPEMTPRVRLLSVPYVARVASGELDDTIDLGSATSNGQLRIFSNGQATQTIMLNGSGSRIATYGSDGLEQIRLWGPTWGEILLFDNDGNNRTVKLSATDNGGGQLSLYPNDAFLSVPPLFIESAPKVLADGGAGTVAADTSVDVVNTIGGAAWASITKTSGGGRLVTTDETGATTAIMGSQGLAGGQINLYQKDGRTGINLDGDSGGNQGGGSLTVYQADGGTGVFIDGDSGGAGYVSVRNASGSSRVVLDGESATGGGELTMYDANGRETVEIVAHENSNLGGQIILRKGDGTATIEIDADYNGDGRVVTQELEITGGSDLSEQFDVKTAGLAPEPGMVLCIDPDKPGQLVVSATAYDRTVAGILSGAGGVKPGMLMGQRGTKADGQHPVALTGRVYAWCDASHGAIRPGDLLTTSGTPGHAMAVKNHDKAQGAIIGKAMTALESGKGLVLVLVSLQ